MEIMKTKLFNLLIILLIIPNLIFAVNKKHFTKTKIIKKEFEVTPNAILKVINKYGNIDLAVWNKNKISFEITITTNGFDEKAVEKKLNQINVLFDVNDNYVSAITEFRQANKWKIWNNKQNVNYEINYIIKLPRTNQIDITNDYGIILLDELDGAANINISYGKLIIGDLKNSANTIKADYIDASTINFIKGGTINTNYSKLDIYKSNIIKLNADYADISFNSIEELDFNCDYGSLKVENGSFIKGTGDYLTMKFGKVKKSLLLNSDFGSIRVNKIVTGFKQVDIKADYTGIKMGVNSDVDFDFMVNLDYANLKIDKDKIVFDKKIEKKSSKKYEGYFNNRNSESNIMINSNYGGVNIFSN